VNAATGRDEAVLLGLPFLLHYQQSGLYFWSTVMMSFLDIHRITELFKLEGTFKGHLVQLSCNEQGHLTAHQVLRAPSSLTLSVFRDGACTASLGNLCQCLNAFIVKQV